MRAVANNKKPAAGSSDEHRVGMPARK